MRGSTGPSCRGVGPIGAVVIVVSMALPAFGASAQDASQLYRQAAAAFGAGSYAEAIELFERAYAISPDPALLYNLGLARERAGDGGGAIDAYERFLAEVPDAPERTEVERSLAHLRQQRDLELELAQEREANAQARAEPPTPPEAAADGGAPIDPGLIGTGVTLAVLGLGGLGAGVGVGATAQSSYDEARVEPIHRRAQELERDARDLALVANVAFVAGGVLALAGTVVLVGAAVSATDADTPEIAVSIGPASASLRGRF